jgi:hypothetical protein
MQTLMNAFSRRSRFLAITQIGRELRVTRGLSVHGVRIIWFPGRRQKPGPAWKSCPNSVRPSQEQPWEVCGQLTVRIFISYRRDDSEGEAGRLFADLVNRFGEASVFMDVAGIGPGRDFRKAIDESLAACDVLLAIIGRDWIDAKNDEQRRRLDDANDFVRIETASALKREIPVIPVLVRGAKMPRAEQLPGDLRELAYRHGVELTHARWGTDLQALIEGLGGEIPVNRNQVCKANGSSPRPFLYRVLDLQPHEASLFAALPGFVLLTGSAVLGIDHVLTPNNVMYSGPAGISREVGYVPALNWSVTYLLLFPISLYFMISALQGTAHALEELYARKMVRRDHQILSDYKISESWIHGTSSRERLLWIFAAVIPVVFSLSEWFLNNLLRLFGLLGGGPTASYQDYDWGLAGLMFDWSTPHKILNAAFDLLAFGAQGTLYAASLAFFIVLLDGRRALLKQAGKLYIVPDLKSDDVRRGFEVFSIPLQHMLLSALTSYLICYLVRLESVYMNSFAASSLATFVSSLNLGRIVLVAFTDWKSLPAELLRLFDPGPYAFRGVLSCVLSGIVSAFSLIAVISTIRLAAADARTRAARLLKAGTATLFGGQIADETEKVKSMQVWPLAYIGLNALVTMSLLAVVTLYFYKIGLYFALLTLVVLLIKALATMVRGFGRSAGQNPVRANGDNDSDTEVRP